MINTVKYRDAEGRTHWSAIDAPHLVAGLASGELHLIDDEGETGAPSVPDDGPAAHAGSADY